MKANSILETIGNTPHVRINRLFSSDVEVWSKLERANPGGSIKDRIALSMIEDAEAKSAAEGEKILNLFSEKLGVEAEIAEILVNEGFSSLEEIAYVPVQELLEIDGFDQELVNALRERAKAALLTQAIADEQALDKEPAADLLEMEGMDKHTAYLLASNGVITREDLAEQAVDDILEFGGIDEEKAAELIMTARKIWFEDEK